MAATTEQKVDFLLKKIGYVASKTGIAEDENSLSGTKKAPFAEAIPSPLVTPSTSIWADASLIPSTPPGSDTSYVKVYLTGTSGVRMTVDNTVSGNRTFLARSTYGNDSSAILGDWIDTSFSADYIIKVFKGDPNSGGVQLSAAGAGSNDTWFFDYSSGVLNFNGTQIPSGVTSSNIYIVGYRYIGAKGGRPAAGIATFASLDVSGISTFRDDVNFISANGNNILFDKSDNALEFGDNVQAKFGDSGDLTIFHNGSHSYITNQTNYLYYRATQHHFENAAGNEIQAKFVENGAAQLYFNNALKIATRVDGVEVTGTTDTDNLVVSGVATVASAKISDLTNNRIVLAGTAGELEDDANLTFDGSQLSVVGIITHVGKMVNTGGIEIDSVGISSNIISTRPGSGDQLFIDPFPTGGSNEGTVIIKGDLQVDGTTTTVNSTTATVNDPIMRVGDVTSIRTVMATVSSGANTITVDSVTGLQTDDIVAATGIPGNTTISSINTGTKVITLSANTTAGITTTTQLTVTHAKDTNTDRGISFNYNTSTGTANNKLGFFGMDDSQVGANGSRVWTYVPDATNTSEVISGTKGYLDIKGIYYQSGDFSTHGITYFDSTGLQNSTTAPGSATFTSTQLLTAVTEIAITLGSAQSVTAGDLVTQAGGGSQQGVVKSTSNSTTVTLIGVTGTFNTSADLILNGTGTGKTPSNVSTTYTSKPMWTTTIDGGTF